MGFDQFMKKYLRCGLLQQQKTLTHHISQSKHPNTCAAHSKTFWGWIFAGPAANCHPKQFSAIPAITCCSFSLHPSSPSLGVPYHREIWLCHLINTITADCDCLPCAEHHPHAPRYLLPRQGNTKLYTQEMEKVKVNILAGGNIYGKNPWISELYSFHWHFLTALTFYISCGWLLFNMF